MQSSVGSLLPAQSSSQAEDQPRITIVPDDEDTETPEEDAEEGADLVQNLIDQIGKVNIAEDVSDEILEKLGQLVVREYQVDENSRTDWKEKTEKALKFANQETEEKQYPWPKASNVIYPLITTAAMQFAARTYPAIIQNRNVVKGVVWGSDQGTPILDKNGQPVVGPDGQPAWIEPPGAKRTRADKIGGHMSYQLLDEMPEWEPQMDTLLHMIPIVGGAARKTFYDPIEDRNYSLLVSLVDLVWNFHAKSFETAPRHTEILTYYPVEIEEFERAKLFLKIEYGFGDADARGTEGGGGDSQDEDAPHLFLEQHRTYDLDGDGYPEPYVVTVHKKSSKVVRIVARYDDDGIIADQEQDSGEQTIIKIIPNEYYTLIPFLPNPKGGSYPIGFGHLLRPLNEAINTSLNQMFDAGHLQNAGGGFIGTSLSLASGPVAFQVGKYIPVNNKGQAIRDAVFPIPFPGPSGVLFQLLGTLLQAGKDVASIQDVMTGDSSMANQPPTTILALIEQGMKLYTAIHKRIYRALKSEFAKLYALNLKRIKRAARFRIGDEWLEVTPDDYRQGGGVEPIADPTMVTDMQKLGRAQILMQFLNDPLINQVELRRRFLDAAMFDRIDELLITQPQMSPADQLKMQEVQMNIARQRAAELKDTTQAVLNLAQSRKIADEKEMAWIDQQLEVMKMHVEAANTMVKAADVELRSRDRVHATKVGARTPGTAEAKKEANNVISTPIEHAQPGQQSNDFGEQQPPSLPQQPPQFSPGGNQV